MMFISQLWLRDRSVEVSLLGRIEPRPDEAQIARFDYIFRFDGGKLVQVKPQAVAK
jgi:hypothetical protein